MYKYQQEILEKYEAAAKFIEGIEMNNATAFIILQFHRSLSPYARKKFKEDGYSIDEHGLHCPEELLPVIDMPCAKSTDDRMGCYFVGMVGVNPITQTNYYLVKVGFATDISRRIKQYASLNPMIYHNNCVLHIDSADADDYRTYEANCHEYLAQHAIGRAQNSTEWFYVTHDTYMTMCERFTDRIFFTKVALQMEV